MKKYYSSDNIRAQNCQYNLIIGKRSNGKSYDALYHGIDDCVKSGYKAQFALVRRWDEDFAKQRASSMFQSLLCDGNGENQIEKLTGGRYNNIYYYSRKWYFAKWDEDEQRLIKSENPFAFGFSLSAMEHDKSTSYPFVKTIIFDEFITRGSYLKDEFVLFMNVVSTIVRDRLDVKIFMLANTVNQYAPYFDEMGLYRIREQKPGTIDIYQMGDSDLHVAVEYCADTDKIKQSKTNNNLYWNFNNSRLQMITDGVWEMDLYPHCPCSYKSSEIVFTFFIVFKSDVLQCECILHDMSQFIFIHRKTTPIKHPDTDLIYSLDYDCRPNYKRRIMRPTTPVEQRITVLFNMDKVFYQDNQTGEIVRNFIEQSEM